MRKVLKKLYVALPFKQQLFTLLKKVWRVPERIYRHLSFNGVFKVKVDKNHSFKLRHYGFVLENEIFWEGLTGHWEKESLELWIKLCRQSNIIFDIGANTGVYSLVAKSLNPGAQVYAFEPVNTIFTKLEANARLNNLDIHCHEMGLSNMDGKMAIYKVNSDHLYEATLNKIFEAKVEGERRIDVEVLTLKTFIETHRIPRIDLMKIDVETHEPEVLEGLAEYLDRFKPVILIELITDYVVAGVMPHFANLDYLYFNIDDKNGVHKVDKVDISASHNYLFCLAEQAKSLNLI